MSRASRISGVSLPWPTRQGKTLGGNTPSSSSTSSSGSTEEDDHGEEEVTHGLRANLGQVAIHLAIAFCIGVSLRLVLLPEALLADESKPSKTDFLIFFGISKAMSDHVGGTLADKWGRKRAALLGWGFGVGIVPVMLLGLSLHSRAVLDMADMMLGAMQGLTWGLNIICLMDILGPQGRGFASALSNAVGYFGSAVTAPVAARLVGTAEDPQADPRWCVAALAASVSLGLLFSGLAVDTQPWVVAASRVERQSSVAVRSGCGNVNQLLCSMGGLTVNTATATVWGPALLWLKGVHHYGHNDLGMLEGYFTAAKVLSMLGTGFLAYFMRPQRIAAAALFTLAVGLLMLEILAQRPFITAADLILSATIVGVGTGAAYPVLAAAVTEGAAEGTRASVYGAYRMWRDLGYAAGGLAARFLPGGFSEDSVVVCAWSFLVAILFGLRLVLWPICANRLAKGSAVETHSDSEEVEAANSPEGTLPSEATPSRV